MQANQITIAEANELQAQWMAFDNYNSKEACLDMTRRYARLPGSYYVTNANGEWMPMVHGQPLLAKGTTLKEAKRLGETWCDNRIGWNATTGQWIEIPAA